MAAYDDDFGGVVEGRRKMELARKPKNTATLNRGTLSSKKGENLQVAKRQYLHNVFVDYLRLF